MSHTPTNVTTLDLHGRRLEDAISEVTLFLERIRRTASSRGRLGGQHVLFVSIITGSGSHGPVLRDAIRKLMEKRGMNFSLERGGGAFQVDALSGWELYAPAPATDSKVLLTEQNEFNQLALARRRNNVGSFANAMCTSSGPPRAVSVPSRSPIRRNSSDPLPSQVASEDAEMRNAVQLSVSESQQQRNNQYRINTEYERQYHRAVSESQIDDTRKTEDEESLLKVAYEQSILEEKHRQRLTEQQYEDALMLAIEQSAQEPLNDDKVSEDDLIEQALAESRALAEAEKAKTSEDDLLEKVLAESKLDEERRKASEHELPQEAWAKSSEEEDTLKEVMKLSLKQQEEEAMAEEEAVKKAIEMSKHMC
ncbi:hypothetical protein ACHAXR_012302 [Thalassiosira sp. AJA248-18]